jgi:hypothetical protein
MLSCIEIRKRKPIIEEMNKLLTEDMKRYEVKERKIGHFKCNSTFFGKSVL